MTSAFDAAREYIAGLEGEAAANPKSFYGNKNLEADGHERVGSALSVVGSLKQRLEALVRGK